MTGSKKLIPIGDRRIDGCSNEELQKEKKKMTRKITRFNFDYLVYFFLVEFDSKLLFGVSFSQEFKSFKNSTKGFHREIFSFQFFNQSKLTAN